MKLSSIYLLWSRPRPAPRIASGVVALLLAATLLSGPDAAAQESAKISFSRDVRPILSDNCFHCHGPDKQRSRLRLDLAEVALEKGAIVPGDTAASELVKRISSSDPEYHMPPPEANRRLTREQIDTLIRWIAEGAVYEEHWAFKPIPPKHEPDISDENGWIQGPIDAFVLQRLQSENVQPQPEAAKERLLRRVTIDLTGLPPSIEEVDAFLNDGSPEAYARAVERLLDDPAYGERMAMDWLDIARYADTYGYQNDRPNNVWPWRDWVIRAFNDNLPYDDFIRWQLAGDLLPEPSQDQVLATSFNRLHRQTNEGGSINEEYLAEYAADRTETFATAFLGMTLQCARCHDHKFDPISQREYYELSAFFNNIDESGLYSHFTNATPTPTAFLYEGDQAEKHEELKQAIRDAEGRLAVAEAEAHARFDDWLQGENQALRLPYPTVHLPLDGISEGKTRNLASAEKPPKLTGSPILVEGRSGQALHFSGDNGVEISGADFERTDPFSIAFWTKTGDGTARMVVCHRSAASSDAGSRGYEVLIDEGRLMAGLIHFWPGNALRVKSSRSLPQHEWVHVTVTYDGSSRADGLHIYFDGAPVEVEVVRDNLHKTIRYENQAQPPLILASRFRDPGFKDGTLDEFQVFDVCLSDIEVRSIAGLEGNGDRDDGLFPYYLNRIDGKYAGAREKLTAARKAESDHVESLREIMVMHDMPKPASARVLARGVYDKPREEVFPNTPASMPPFPDDYPRNRLGLAEWLVDRDHPLAARVAVNRIWKIFHGRGLVQTAEDFGNQGANPTHPELLDYLAAWFIDSGWDTKALCRLIVMSAAYRQDSTPSAELLQRDPDNILLARGPRNRLDAEQIRDAALFAGDLLVAKTGGPSVKPYQPAGLWHESSSLTYTPDSGESLYRRSMYTFIKRTVPPPMMLTFDATNREVCVARREVTQTPLQALVLLNDPQFVEAARALAEQTILNHGDDVPARFQEAFLRMTGRAPSDPEAAVLLATYEEQLEAHGDDPEGAEAYTAIGERPVADGLDRIELAATTAVVQLIMNFEEFQVKL